mmetsp:Transcript_34788/g.103692  ORF Transcript_34788/g.103692 Transcript_34788/m.103692 type:complete len:317 (-) Transcript_34788:460-1410(-)
MSLSAGGRIQEPPPPPHHHREGPHGAAWVADPGGGGPSVVGDGADAEGRESAQELKERHGEEPGDYDSRDASGRRGVLVGRQGEPVLREGAARRRRDSPRHDVRRARVEREGDLLGVLQRRQAGRHERLAREAEADDREEEGVQREDAAVKHDQHRREAGRLHAGVGAAGGHLLRRARLDVDSVEPQAGRGGGRVEHRPQGCGGEARAAEREARQEGRPPRSRQRERVPKDRAGGEPAGGRQPAREARQREARRPKRARLPLSLPAPALDDDSRAALKVDARPSRRACSLQRLQLDVTLSGWEAPELPRRLDRGRL